MRQVRGGWTRARGATGVGLLALLLACGGGDRPASAPPTTSAGGDGGPAQAPPDAGAPPAWSRGECPAIYGQALLPTFELEIAPEVLDALAQERRHGADFDAANESPPYHPLVAFHYQDQVIRDAQVQLRGNPSFWTYPKMQLEISFNETRKSGRFVGLRKLVLDAAHYNRSLLRDRLALYVMRRLGLPAPCGNNARLVINGAYYGLYQNLEKIDREFLERSFEQPDGNLYRRGRVLKTNEATADPSRIERFWDTYEVAALEALVDLDEALLEWAAEAALPDGDGYWAGGWNWLLYDVPGGRFVFLPWDLDLAFTHLPASTDPIVWHKANENDHGRPHYDAVLADPAWHARYVDAVARARGAYEPADLQARVDEWAAQIDEAVRTDPHLGITYEEHVASVRALRAYLPARAAFLDGWLACWQGGGADRDGDGRCDP